MLEDFLTSFEYVRTVKSGNVFRDWLIEVLGDRIRNKDCEVRIFKLSHASHRVCRYEFKGEGFSVIAKFLGIPAGMIKKEGKVRTCGRYTKKLHENTQTYYDKENEFSKFNYILKHLKIDRHEKEKYERLLEKWRCSSFLDRETGCITHNDATPVNYMFHRGRPFLLDFELASRHGYFACDPGILCAELKHYFARKGSSQRAEPYIRHFLKHYSRDEEEFRQITRVIPFYMAYGLLRIAILKWNARYRNYLLREAKNCLKAIEGM